MKKKINEMYSNLKDISNMNKKSEAYKKHMDRLIFKNSIAMLLVQFIFIYILKTYDVLVIRLGIKLSSLVMFIYMFTNHMKGMKEKKMEKGNAVFAFLHLVVESYILFI